MSDRNDSFSDLERAADLSRSLHNGVEPAPDRHEYARLDRAPIASVEAPARDSASKSLLQGQNSMSAAASVTVAATAGPGPLRAASPPPVSSAYGSDAWDQFLDGCMRLGNATSGFILDHRGLAVALSGRVVGSVAESFGSRLLLAMDELGKDEQLGVPDHPCIAIRVQDGWLSAATVANGELAIGLLAPGSLSAEVWDMIHDGANEMLAIRRG